MVSISKARPVPPDPAARQISCRPSISEGHRLNPVRWRVSSVTRTGRRSAAGRARAGLGPTLHRADEDEPRLSQLVCGRGGVVVVLDPSQARQGATRDAFAFAPSTIDVDQLVRLERSRQVGQRR